MPPARPSPPKARRLPSLAAVGLSVGLLVVGAAVPANADKLGTARQQARVLRARLTRLEDASARAVGSYEATRFELESVVAEHHSARTALQDAESDTGSAQNSAANRIRAIYIGGGPAALYISAIRAGNPAELMSRVANISAVVRTDTTAVGTATESLRMTGAAQARLHKAARSQIVLEERAAAETLEISRLLEEQRRLVREAAGEVRRLLEEQRERKLIERAFAQAKEMARLAALAVEEDRLAGLAAERPTDALTGGGTSGGGTGNASSPYRPAGGRYSCPVGPDNSFIDTWHAPRSGGRVHQGTDVFAPYGSPAYAVTDGVIDKWGNGGLGGVTLWLRAVNGDRYYYAHNSLNLATVGTRVRAGDVIAYVGNTGNARTTPPHIHFEAHPGGGAAANPYPFLAAICGKL